MAKFKEERGGADFDESKLSEEEQAQFKQLKQDFSQTTKDTMGDRGDDASRRTMMAYTENIDEFQAYVEAYNDNKLREYANVIDRIFGTKIEKLSDLFEYDNAGLLVLKEDRKTKVLDFEGKTTDAEPKVFEKGTNLHQIMGMSGFDSILAQRIFEIQNDAYRKYEVSYEDQDKEPPLSRDKFLDNFLERKLPSFATGGLITENSIVRISEDARFSPEGIFNKPQMQYIADLIKPKETVVKFKSENDFVKNPQIQERYVAMNTMQTENETRRREMATPIVMPPSAPNIVDNKNITVQEQFNVTELLPAPSSHVSFKDNIVY